MIRTWNEIVEIEGGINNARKSTKNGKYQKVSHGVYVDDNVLISELEQLFVRYPRATLTLQSAFGYYDLSDYIPDKYYIVTPYNAHTINDDKVSQSYMSEEMIEIGRVKVQTKYGYIYIFDLERMLIELFRLKNKLSREYFLELVVSYRKSKMDNQLSLYKVSSYCMKMKNGDRLLREIQEMI